MKTLAERLKFAREAKGKIWTQRHLAVACGLSTGTIGMMESGKRGNKDGSIPGTVPRIAKVLGVRYDWLAYGEEPMAAEEAAESTASDALTALAALEPAVQMLLVQIGTLLTLTPEESRDQAYLAATNALLRHLQPAAPKRQLALPGRLEKPPV